MCLLVPNQCWHCSLCYWVWLLSWDVTQRSIPSGWGHTAQAVALNLLDKTLRVLKPYIYQMWLNTSIYFLFSSAFFFSLTVFLFALEYFHKIFNFFFLLVLRLVVWRGVFGWFSVMFGFGFFFLLQRSWSKPEWCCCGKYTTGNLLHSQELFDWQHH